MTVDRPDAAQRGSRRLRRRRALIVLAILVALAGLAASPLSGLPAVFGWQRSEYQSAGPAATLGDLQDVEQLAALFNEHEGVPRLILLLSPT